MSLYLFGQSAYAAVHQVESIGLTVSDLDSEVRFFTQVLSFEEVSCAEIKGQPADDLLGLRTDKSEGRSLEARE